MDKNDIEVLLRNCLPEGFFYEWLTKLGEAYKRTWREAHAKLAPPEAKDLLPHLRRAQLEGDLRKLANKFGLSDSTYQLNDGRNQFHSEVRHGELILTQSAVKGPREVVRSACFRGTLAQVNQMDLFRADGSKPADSLFGILIHGPDTKDYPWIPAFARLAFPDATQKYYVANMDLFRFCGFDQNSYLETTPIEATPQTRTPVLLPGVAAKKLREE